VYLRRLRSTHVKRASIVFTNVKGIVGSCLRSSIFGRIAMFDDAFARRRRTIGLIIALTAALSWGPLLPKHARAEGPDEGADLAARF
jgi:hypothetical protein